MKKLYLDYDGVIVNTMKAIVSLYNEDFSYYKDFRHVNWWDIRTYGFEECQCANIENIKQYFNQPRFFCRVEYMPWAERILLELSEEYDIIIVSAGYSPNLAAKIDWISKHMPYASFIGVNLKTHSDKSHIDMKDGIFIDDSANNLITSNAQENICFGEIYPWNQDWTGLRLTNWMEVKNYLL